MQGRSWMAALTLVAASAGALAPITRAAEPPPIKQTVKLKVRVDGTGSPAAEGAEIVVKPGHPGCRFKPIRHPLKGDGDIDDIPLIEVESFGADRDCSFAITLKEPGHPDKTVRRSLQLVPAVAGKPAQPLKLSCYLTSRSLSGPAGNPIAGKPAEETRKK